MSKPLTSDHFFKAWTGLLAAFHKEGNDIANAMQFKALKGMDPELTCEQFDYAVGQCLLSCKFMPSLAQVLREIYAPDHDTWNMPALPDIDPRYADEYQLSQYNRALAVQQKWCAERDHKPHVGYFRVDRILEIPGIPDAARKAIADPHYRRYRLGGDSVTRDQITEAVEHTRMLAAAEEERAALPPAPPPEPKPEPPQPRAVNADMPMIQIYAPDPSQPYVAGMSEMDLERHKQEQIRKFREAQQ